MFDSLVNQTYKNIEIIVINDGCTDQSPSICKKYAEKDNRIVIINQKNCGLFATRITGINNAKGEYITFVDPDDWIDKNSIKNCLEVLNETQADIIQFSTVNVYGFLKYYKNKERKLKTYSHKEIINEKLLGLCGGYTDVTTSACNKMYNASYLKTNLLSYKNTRIFMGEDLLLNLLVIPTVNSITVTNIPLYFYRQCSGGTSVFNESKFYDFDKVKKKQFEIINKYDNKDLWFRCHYETVFIYQWACIEYIVHNPNENINKYFDKIKEYSLCEFVVEAKKYFKENQIEDEAVKIFIGDNPEEYYEYLKKINFCKSVKSVMLKKIKRLLSFFEF